jgi:hypothetical protein
VSQKPPISEGQISRQITDWLTLRRVLHYRNNTGGFGKAGHFYRFGAPGAGDIVCIVRGKHIEIEVKTASGIQSQRQFAWQKNLEAAGGIYLLVSSLDEVIEYFSR